MKKVQVLLSTYNGEHFLEDQLLSLAQQQGVDHDVLVRDDGSSDSTTEILSKWHNKGLLSWYQGENLKPAKSFMDLMRHSIESDADYYAFCDQDDVWDSLKLEKAAERLDAFDPEKPALYFSKAQLVDKELNIIQHKHYPTKAYTFGQALIRNNATGCTMVFNRKLLDIVNSFTPEYIPMHDYWVYLICLGMDGQVFFDNNSYIKYRQHGSNAVGGNASIFKLYKNKLDMLIGRDRNHKKNACELLKGYYDILPRKNRILLEKIKKYEDSFSDKIALIFDPDIKNNNIEYDIYFYIAVLFGAF
jgi:rhamnosyltransferase